MLDISSSTSDASRGLSSRRSRVERFEAIMWLYLASAISELPLMLFLRMVVRRCTRLVLFVS